MKKSDAIQLNIPNPCRQDWNKMHPVDGGRFCDSCQHAVIDFTGYTDAQLYSFFSAHQGQRVCGRVNAMQLNRPIHIPPQPHSRLYRLAIAAGLTILALVPMYHAEAKFRVPFAVESTFTPEAKNDNAADSITIRGIVLDEKKEPMIGTVVRVFNNGQEIGGVATGADGNFIITLGAVDRNARLEINASYTSYQRHSVFVKAGAIKAFYKIEMKVRELLGMIEIIHYPPLINPSDPNTNILRKSQIDRMAR